MSLKVLLAKNANKSPLLPALAFAVFSAAVIDVMLPLLLADIAKTFQVTVGTASIISSISSLAGVAAGLVMALLSVRLNHKRVLLLGIECIAVAALGTYLAPSLSVLFVLYSLNGVGSVMIGAMALSIIGEVYPLQNRSKAVGWIVAAGFLAFTVGAPMTGLLASFGTWRNIMLYFNLPVSVVSLLFAFKMVPSIETQSPERLESTLAGCKNVLWNRSAIACLVGIMFGVSTGAVTTFVVSYWRQAFSLSIVFASIITMVNATVAAVGGVIAGRLINRTGRKPLVATAGLAESVLIVLTFIVPNLGYSWAVSIIRVFCYGMLSASFASLALEQIPDFRATMMSMRGAFGGIGSFIGITLGGLVLNLFNYQAAGASIAALGLIAITITMLFAKDPTKK
jgi:MFS transporter, DHA1 family, inner membrane transport protein